MIECFREAGHWLGRDPPARSGSKCWHPSTRAPGYRSKNCAEYLDPLPSGVKLD